MYASVNDTSTLLQTCVVLKIIWKQWKLLASKVSSYMVSMYRQTYMYIDHMWAKVILGPACVLNVQAGKNL